jgi:hypothetical protein
MTRSIDLGSGPHKAWGAALSPRYRGTLETPPLITERTRKLGGQPCPQCGERTWHCDCEEPE